MKKFQLYITMIACGLFSTLNSCDSEELSISPDEVSGVQIEKPEVSAKGTKLSSVNGQGAIFEAQVQGGVNRRFSFHANTMPDGSITGKAVITYIGGEGKTMIDIDCMSIDGNSAKLSGTVISNTNNPATIGSGCVFKIIDNGEGKNAESDQISYVYFSSLSCADGWTVATLDIDAGNIQVKN